MPLNDASAKNKTATDAAADAATTKQPAPRVLLTGGAGYIGSHTCVALIEAGFEPVILDNFCNSHPAVLARLQRLTGRTVLCERGDVNDTAWVAQVLRHHSCQAVVHFAGLKAVGESVQQPLRYYRHNVAGLLSVLEAMTALPGTCRSLVFSSSATVYGEPASVPIREDFPCAPQSPYAHSKRQCEQLLADLGASDSSWRLAVLRYFNPVGAHPSGLIGEDPSGVPNNLMPFLSQVAVGQRPALQIFGQDYATPDGTGVRDYLHVCDLAEGHVAALEALLGGAASFTANLGTGEGTSVLGVLRAFEEASGRRVPFAFAPRRPGDVAAYYADASRAFDLFGWRATRGLQDMCLDAWNWQQRNPQGYRSDDPDTNDNNQGSSDAQAPSHLPQEPTHVLSLAHGLVGDRGLAQRRGVRVGPGVTGSGGARSAV